MLSHHKCGDELVWYSHPIFTVYTIVEIRGAIALIEWRILFSDVTDPAMVGLFPVLIVTKTCEFYLMQV